MSHVKQPIITKQSNIAGTKQPMRMQQWPKVVSMGWQTNDSSVWGTTRADYLQRALGNRIVSQLFESKFQDKQSIEQIRAKASSVQSGETIIDTNFRMLERSPCIQRVVEVRPPGRGEASAFNRRNELLDRLNSLSTGMKYKFEGKTLRYEVTNEHFLTHFDRQMQAFMDRTEMVPMRLITHSGRVLDERGKFVPLLADSFINAYVDIDDLLADDDYSFQSDLIHFLTERFHVPGYDRLIGTDFTPKFKRAHRAGKRAEAAFLQSILNDPTIRFNYEDTRPNGTWINAFKSKEGYRVLQTVRNPEREVAGGTYFVLTKDKRRLTIDQFRTERASATTN